MNGKRHTQYVKGGMTVLCIAIFLFSYVNATMFWHGHSGAVYHSHLSSAAHRSAPASNPHTTAELLLIQAASQASCTDDVIPASALEPQRVLVETVLTEPVSSSVFLSPGTSVLRGPPALV